MWIVERIQVSHCSASEGSAREPKNARFDLLLTISLDLGAGRKLVDEERSERFRLADGTSKLECLAEDLDIERAAKERQERLRAEEAPDALLEVSRVDNGSVEGRGAVDLDASSRKRVLNRSLDRDGLVDARVPSVRASVPAKPQSVSSSNKRRPRQAYAIRISACPTLVG